MKPGLWAPAAAMVSERHCGSRHRASATPRAASIQNASRASLVAQWLRVCLLMQGTRVRALVWEDPACRGVTGPVSHNY